MHNAAPGVIRTDHGLPISWASLTKRSPNSTSAVVFHTEASSDCPVSVAPVTETLYRAYV
jgi:hypothetical protein